MEETSAWSTYVSYVEDNGETCTHDKCTKRGTSQSCDRE
jgi:hypothetical protein